MAPTARPAQSENAALYPPPPLSQSNNTNTNKEHQKHMKLMAKTGGDFSPHPETEGTVQGVIVDVTPLKTQQSQFGEREVFRVVYETEVTDPDHDDRRFCVWSRPYTPSLNPKANFRKDLKKILGRDLTATEEAEGFDTESLIGRAVSLIVQHEEGSNGNTYSVISFIGPDKSKSPLKPSGAYTRVKDRPEKPEGEGSSYRKAPAAKEDEGRAPWQKVKVHVGKHAGVDLGDLDEDAVKSLIEKWLPKHRETAKPKADDKRLAAALEEVMELLGMGAEAAADEY